MDARLDMVWGFPIETMLGPKIRLFLLFWLPSCWGFGSLAWSRAVPRLSSGVHSIHVPPPTTEEDVAADVPSAPAQMSSDRRRFVTQIAAVVPLILWNNSKASAAEELFVRQTNEFAYSFIPPPGFASPSQKPIKTHLDEVNFKNGAVQYGITVDPLRIGSLREFGTPEEVAAKVVLAEVNRDGIFDVTLMENPFDGDEYYQLNYRSSGKRGIKRYVAKFYITNKKLYALTAQCNEVDYEATKEDILNAVDSFKILPSKQ